MKQKLTTKQKMIKYLSKNANRTFTVKQAQKLFGVKNISARISELRAEGYSIKCNVKVLKNGEKINYYNLTKVSA